MTRDTFMATMTTLRQRRPFHPFTISLINGDRFEVDFPDALLVRDGVGAYVAPGGVPHIFDCEGVNEIIGDLMAQPAG